MPTVIVYMLEGRTLEQKRQLVKEVTDAVSKTAKASPEQVTVFIQDLPREHVAIAGKLFSDKK